MEQTVQKTVMVSGGSWVTLDIYGDEYEPGIVVLPGVMSDSQSWTAVARSVSAWPSVTVVNRRGRAPSGPLTVGYPVGVEVDDLVVVLGAIPEPISVFGWSYGGLIALLAADVHPINHLIAYEPVTPPFARDALAALQRADVNGDRDRIVEIVNREISRFSDEHIESLRSDTAQWDILCELSASVYAELSALDAVDPPQVLARNVDYVDLIIGELNRSQEPYGTSFELIRGRIPDARIHELAGTGHLAHVDSPAQLGRVIDGTFSSR